MSYPSLWIQSLLLLSAQRSQIISSIQGQRQKESGFVDEEITSGESIHSNPNVHFTFVRTFQQSTISVPQHTPQPEAFWPLTIQPAASFLENVGNGFVTSHFPIHIHCILQAIICGSGSVDFSWSLDGPCDDNKQSTLHVTSRPYHITWRSLAFFSHFHAPDSLKVCRIKSPVTFLVQEPGLYIITARLNEQEASYLPLVISPSASEDAPSPGSAGKC